MKVSVPIALLVVAACGSAYGQTPRDVFESDWTGGSKTRADADGKAYTYVYEKLSGVAYEASDNSFTGVLTSTVLHNGAEYFRRADVRGTFEPSDNSVTIMVTGTGECDALPSDQEWDNGPFFLTAYSDGDHNGYYILAGRTERQSHPDEYFELGTWPRY